MSFLELLSKGGLVMIPLFICSLIAIAILLERRRFYKQCHTDVAALTDEVATLTASGQWAALKERCTAAGGQAAQIIAQAADYDKRPEKQEKFVELKAQTVAVELRRNLNYLSTIVTLAPLMGLLGTVTGMINSFSVLSVSQGQPFAITGGVGEALIATATGLCVAIIALIIHTYLKQRQDILIGEMEELGSTYLLALDGDSHAN